MQYGCRYIFETILLKNPLGHFSPLTLNQLANLAFHTPCDQEYTRRRKDIQQPTHCLLFTKFKGHLVYFYTGVLITTCFSVVLNIHRCTLYVKRVFVDRQSAIRHSLLLMYSCCNQKECGRK